MPPITKLNTELALDSKKFNKGIGSARKKMKGFTSSLGGMKAGLLGVFGAAAVGSFVRNTLQQADAIGKFSDRIGISTTALQEWRFAFDKAGLSAAEVDKGLLNFVKNLGEARQGTGTLVTFLKKYDESLLEVLQSHDDNTSALESLFDALGKTENQADKVALANAALGRSGKQMVSAFKEGTTSFEAWIERGREMGVVIDEDLIRGAEQLNDEVSAVAQAISTKFKTAFLESTPVILQFAEALSDALIQLNDFFNPSLEDQFKRLVAQGELIVEVIDRLQGGEVIPFVNLEEQFKKLQQINIELESVKKKLRQEVTIGLEKEVDRALPPEKAQEDSGIKTLFETIDLVDMLDKKRDAAFEAEFQRKMDQAQLDAELLKRLAEGNETTGQQIIEIWEAVGQNTEDAIVDALTGASSAMEAFKDVALAVLEDIMREIVRTSFIKPVFGGEGGFIGAATNFFGGFANGGSFTVPGSGGTDTSPVSFLATPGERVDISTPGQASVGDGGGVTIVQNIQTGVAQTVRAEMMQLIPQIIEQAKRGVFDADRRGGQFSRG